MKKIFIVMICTLVVVALVGCSPSVESKTEATTENQIPAASSDKKESGKEVEKEEVFEKVMIDNFNKSLVFDSVPQKVLCLDINSAEVITALGKSEYIGGIKYGNNTIEDVLLEYKSDMEKIPVPESIKEGIPTLEAVIGLAPDMMIFNSFYFNVDVFGTYEDYTQNDIKLYITEGTYVPDVTIENMYNDIHNFGLIFGAETESEALIKTLKGRVKAVSDRVGSFESRRVMSYDNGSEEPFIAGNKALVNNLIELANGENIFSDIDQQFGKVSWEEVIARDPEVIVIHSYGADNNGQDKIDFFKSFEELSEVTAVKNDNFLVVKLNAIFPGIQNVDTVEKMAEAFHPKVSKKNQ